MQAIALEEAETEIRRTVKDEYFKQTPKTALDEKVKKIIREAVQNIVIPALRNAAIRSLLNFYSRQYAEIRRISSVSVAILLSLQKLNDRSVSAPVKAMARRTLEYHGIPKINLYGVPLQKYSQDYINENIAPVIDRLSKQFALDPDDVSGRNSLRNRAEMEVRYNDHLEQITSLKAQGVKLVIASTHADCSARCAPWQGRVYSLDGTSGTTDDGRNYVPLETATDIFYTTKAGKTYKNGLLGFNCRHYLVPYKSGYTFPKPNAAEERRQYAITLKQRQLERNVIKWKIDAVENKGVNKERYNTARKKAQEWNNAYIRYSMKHQRAYYPSRTKVL